MHKELAQPRNAAWDRALHARLVERLTQAGARAIVFDIVFSEPDSSSPASDAHFAAAIKKQGAVVLAAESVPLGDHAEKINPPFALLADNAAAMDPQNNPPTPI